MITSDAELWLMKLGFDYIFNDLDGSLILGTN